MVPILFCERMIKIGRKCHPEWTGRSSFLTNSNYNPNSKNIVNSVSNILEELPTIYLSPKSLLTFTQISICVLPSLSLHHPRMYSSFAEILQSSGGHFSPDFGGGGASATP